MAPPKAIDQLPATAHSSHVPTLLDAHAVEPFLTWLDANPSHISRLVDQSWTISVIRQHLEAGTNWSRLRKRLQTFQIQIVSHRFKSADSALIDEIQTAYFGGGSRTSAELLAYGRRCSSGQPVRIISQHRGFHHIPNVEVYFIHSDFVGEPDEGAFLRTLQSLDMHRHIRKAAFERMLNRDYPTAVVEATKTLFEEIRQIGASQGESYKDDDGRALIDQALSFSMKSSTQPKIRLNQCTTTTEKNEQTGYHCLAAGITSAFRNPISHSPSDDMFIQERFGDRTTAVKALCLLSLLLEKLDKRISPI